VPVRVPADAEGALGMAVLAAGAIGGDVPGAAARLVRLDRTLDPDPDRGAALAGGHVAFVDALERRGWIDPQLADHARTRVSTPTAPTPDASIPTASTRRTP
jgi:hypothetical protein